MNKFYVSFLLALVMMSVGVMADANDTMDVSVNVLKTTVGISVPSSITFQDIAAGYCSERKDLDILNTGTVDIEVTPELEDSYNDSIYDNLAFQKTLSDDKMKIRYFDFEIERPAIVGGTRTENVYMYLDLLEYEEDVNSDIMNHEAEVIFWAVPN